jgi:hypothetical protein
MVHSISCCQVLKFDRVVSRNHEEIKTAKMRPQTNLALILLLFINFISCVPCHNVNSSLKKYFDIKGISAINDNKYSGKSIKEAQDIPIQDYRLYIMLKTKFYSRYGDKKVSAFICNGLAPVGQDGTEEKVKYIKITSDENYDEKHSANQPLNDIVMVYPFSKALDDYLSMTNFSMKQEGLTLTINNPPSQRKSMSFNIEFALTNGEIYRSKTSPVVIY